MDEELIINDENIVQRMSVDISTVKHIKLQSLDLTKLRKSVVEGSMDLPHKKL